MIRSNYYMLQVNNLTKEFGGLRALNDVSFKVNKGEIHGMIGPNGSGKTTVINIISGFYTPTSGNIFYKGTNISGIAPYAVPKMKLVRTFQNINLFPEMTAIENVLTAYSVHLHANFASVVLNTRNFKNEEKEAFNEAHKLLNFVGLNGKEHIQAKNLAYGSQRLLEIARCLATKPDFVMLDEPVAGMNDQESDSVAILIKNLITEGMTILLIEHHMRFVMNLCNIITVLNSGSVIAEGTPKEIQNNSEVIEVYLGKEANLLC